MSIYTPDPNEQMDWSLPYFQGVKRGPVYLTLPDEQGEGGVTLPGVFHWQANALGCHWFVGPTGDCTGGLIPTTGGGGTPTPTPTAPIPLEASAWFMVAAALMLCSLPLLARRREPAR